MTLQSRIFTYSQFFCPTLTNLKTYDVGVCVEFDVLVDVNPGVLDGVDVPVGLVVLESVGVLVGPKVPDGVIVSSFVGD